MTPKETVLKAINNYLKDNLESEGFKFSESQISFSRKLNNGFVQKIVFTANLRNYADGMIRYGEQYQVVSSKYKKWWKDNFPKIPVIGAGILSTDHSAFKGADQTLKSGHHYEFYNSDPKQIMDLIWLNYMNHGKSFFEQNDTWEKLGIIAQRQYSRIDALIFADLKDNALDLAVETQNKYLEHFQSENKMNASAKQIFEIITSRIEYIKKG